MQIKITQPLCYSRVGKKPNQEDSLYPLQGDADQSTRIFMVCDGMGGHEKGEVASACVAETIGKATSNLPLISVEEMKSAFLKALQQAYDNLNELDSSDDAKKMGTTLTFLAICSDGILTAHIGDSRISQFRPSRGIVFQTRDHSLVNDLIAAGELTPEEARTFPQRNVITRAVQPHQEYPAKPAFNVVTDIRKGDVFMLCCDGVLEKLESDELCAIILNNSSLASRIKRIEVECEKRETHDNNTCYLIEMAEVEGAEDVQLVLANPGKKNSTPAPASTAAAGKKRTPNYLLWCIVVLLFAAIAGAIFFFVTSSNRDEASHGKQSEQVGGIIQRHK